MSSHHCDIPGVPIRRVRINHGVIGVVPHDDQAQIVDRSEHGRPGADHYPGMPSKNADELSIPLLRSGIGGQHRKFLRTHVTGNLSSDGIYRLLIRDYHQNPDRWITRDDANKASDVRSPTVRRTSAPGPARDLTFGQPSDQGGTIRVLGPILDVEFAHGHRSTRLLSKFT
jgi:hypothetical protein